MNNKKLGSALAVAAIAVVSMYLFVNQATTDTDVMQAPSVPAAETNAVDMIHEPAPQASTDRFEPLPSVGTGQYTEPEHRKEPATEK